jgi:hypothetical protein
MTDALLRGMADRKMPPRRGKHGGEKMTDEMAKDESGVGRKGGADIDVEKREKELEELR